MSEWKLYSGSDEQIAEIEEHKHNVLFREKIDLDGRIVDMEFYKDAFIPDAWKKMKVYSYFLCNPHPLRDMIKRQADTGQEVWVKEREMKKTGFPLGYRYYATTTPDWNIPNAEYSFTPFEGIKND